MEIITGHVSSKGRITIPVPIRKELGLNQGSKVIFECDGQQIILSKAPDTLDWANLVKQISSEKVEFNDKGEYNPKLSPEFHEWMSNG